MNKNARLVLLATIPLAAALAACNEETSNIGPGLTKGEVTVTVDSTQYDLNARSVERQQFDTRSASHLLGRLWAQEYGQLDCSFVTELLPAMQLAVPDSIGEDRIDSLQLTLKVPRGALIGDSLAPQQLRAYRLTRQLPRDIDNNFDPTGYYDASSPIGTRTYTLTALAAGDSLFQNASAIPITIGIGRDEALRLWRAYRQNPDIFQWPAAFAKVMPGIFVQQTFGRGCIANIHQAYFTLYWHHFVTRTKTEGEGDDKKTITYQATVKDSIGVLTTAPEVLGSNNIRYTPAPSLAALVAEGQNIITTPGGYELQIQFPAQQLLDRYHQQDFSMAVVNALSMSIPASSVTNSVGIGVAPYLLMVKTSEVDSFLAEGKLPDNISSFYATYDYTKGDYNFANMRQYALKLIEKGTADQDDIQFTLMPVMLSIEKETNNYTGAVTQYVTDCTPYTAGPTMTRLHTDRATVCFTFSQTVY